MLCWLRSERLVGGGRSANVATMQGGAKAGDLVAQTSALDLAIVTGSASSGVGHNFQDHLLFFGCIWEHQQPPVVPNASRAILSWKSNPSLDRHHLKKNNYV